MSDVTMPRGWIQAEIGELCDLINGRAFKPAEWSNEGLPIIRIQNLNNPNAAFNHFDGELSDKHRIHYGDLLFAWSGTPGTSFGAHVWKGDEAALNQHIFKVGFDESRIDKRFLRYAINQTLDELVAGAHGGVGLRHVTKGKFEKTRVAFPPIGEQKVIADKLDELLAQVNNLKAHLDAIPAILKRFRQSVLAAAVSGRLTEEWRDENGISIADWESLSVGDVSTVATGKTPSRKETSYWKGGDIPWLTSGSTGSIYTDSADQFVTRLAVEDCSLKIFGPGTLILAMYGEGKTRGQVTELRLSATCNQACAAVIVDDTKVLRAFLKLRLLENYEETRKYAAGGAQPNLNLNKVRAIGIEVPPKREQNEIVRRVDQLFAFADQVEQQVKNAQTRVNKLPQSILAKAFRGELTAEWRVDNPELISGETSAEALLERIKAEKAKQKPTDRGRKKPAAKTAG